MHLTYLETSRIRLRQYQEHDFNRLIELNSDPEVMKYLTDGVPGTYEDVMGGVERTIFYQKKYAGRLGVYTAELLQDGEFMGWFFLRPDKKHLENTKVLELGYRLKQKFWGKGYATEVSAALIKKAFQELGADCVFAQTLVENKASRRVMEKVGLTFEREFIDEDYPRQSQAVLYQLCRSNK